MKLEEGPLNITASYTPCNDPIVPGTLSFTTVTPPPSSHSPTNSRVDGSLYCLNTIERIATFDRKSAARNACDEILEAISSGNALCSPHLLQRFIALVYCDLKHYKYHYWFGSPVLAPQDASFSFTSTDATHLDQESLTTTYTQEEEVEKQGPGAMECVHEYMKKHENPPLFILVQQQQQQQQQRQASVCSSCHPLSEWNQLPSHDGDGKTSKYLVFLDPSNDPVFPGWPLRNALILAALHFDFSNASNASILPVLCLRTSKGRPHAPSSRVLYIDMSSVVASTRMGRASTPWYKCLGGWEINNNAAVIRIADLGPSMDPIRLAASAVDLNLQLMKWRAAPTLDIPRISNKRCLLLGAGTLGCSVARGLLGWGVRHITFVDNSKVSYSNPVRQSLFTFEDCLGGGRSKAAAAAAAVTRIFPDAVATGIEMNIPMPGHPPHTEAEARQVIDNVNALQELVIAHEVVFLLMDTRESRWLGTLLSNASQYLHENTNVSTLAITAALGFDSFVVMRHGAPPPSPSPPGGTATSTATRLGCYFCSDVIAPANSTRDRTMDQQCTVARPGLSGIAGSLAVEMMAAVCEHPLGMYAPPAGYPPPTNTQDEEHGEQKEEGAGSVLGGVPHMIRGQLNGFTQTCMTGHAFPQCPACSKVVVEEYLSRGAEFVLQVVSEPQRYLEDLTGLSELQQQMEEMASKFDDDDDDEEEDVGGGADKGEDEQWEEL